MHVRNKIWILSLRNLEFSKGEKKNWNFKMKSFIIREVWRKSCEEKGAITIS